MKPNLKACGHALVTALVNATLAVALMLLVEFAISGSFQMPEPYLWAGLVIGVVIALIALKGGIGILRDARSSGPDVEPPSIKENNS